MSVFNYKKIYTDKKMHALSDVRVCIIKENNGPLYKLNFKSFR